MESGNKFLSFDHTHHFIILPLLQFRLRHPLFSSRSQFVNNHMIWCCYEDLHSKCFWPGRWWGNCWGWAGLQLLQLQESPSQARKFSPVFQVFLSSISSESRKNLFLLPLSPSSFSFFFLFPLFSFPFCRENLKIRFRRKWFLVNSGSEKVRQVVLPCTHQVIMQHHYTCSLDSSPIKAFSF